MAEKVYTNEIIVESPFPGEPEPVALPSQPNPAGTFSPTTTKAKSFPTRKIAVELIGQALNTRSKKILQEFALQDSGGFKIGNFKEGVSGDVKITPNGIVARDIAGLITIAMYGADGSGVFKGSIQAGSIITGIVDVGDNSIVIDGESKRMVFYDDGGVPQILIGNS